MSRFGDLIYPLLAPRTGGLLLEGYVDFPVGGVDDDAAWTSFMWNRLADWLVYGPPPPDPPPNSPPSETSRKKRGLRQTVLGAKRAWVRSVKTHLLNSSEAFSEGSLFGAYNTRKSDGKPTSGAYIGVNRRPVLAKDAHALREKLLAAELEQLGNSLVDQYLLRVFPDLLSLHSAASVQELRNALRQRAETLARDMLGQVGGGAERPTAESRDQLLLGSGTAQHEYFGSSLSVSAVGDILVGSPGAGRTGGPQEGSAHLILNSVREGGPPKASVTLRGGLGGGVTDAFPSYERFGWASTACDVNSDGIEDWVVCAPTYLGGRDTEAARGNYTGRCDIFYGPFSVANPNPAPDASIYGNKEWGNFGFSVASGDVDGDGMVDLVISAPYAGSYPNIAPNDRDDISSQGAVYVYLATSFANTFAAEDSIRFHLGASAAADWVLQHEESFEWFGRSLAITKTNTGNFLVIGAPSFHSKEEGEENSAVGKLFVYNLAKAGAEYVLGISGCGHAGRTGHALAASAQHLVFSEPSYNVSVAPESQTGREKSVFLRAGRVIAVSWDELFSVGRVEVKVCDLSNVVESLGEGFEARHGSALALSADSTHVIIGAPLANDTRGAVYSLDLTSGAVDVLLSGKTHSSSKGRLGQAIAVHQDAVYIGAPYASIRDGEQEGKVYTL